MSWLGVLSQNLRYALRTFAKKPSFSLTVVALVALGVGATTTIFSVVDNVLLRELPYPDPEELVFLDNPAHSVPMFLDWRDRTSSFSATAATLNSQYDLIGDRAPESIEGSRVTESFFSMLGARPLHGRLFAPDDFVGSPPRVAVVSHSLWQQRWGSDPSVVGRTITLNDNPVQVVGVLDPDFRPPGAMRASTVQVWLPLDLAQKDLQSRGMMVLAVIARLRAAVVAGEAEGKGED